MGRGHRPLLSVSFLDDYFSRHGFYAGGCLLTMPRRIVWWVGTAVIGGTIFFGYSWFWQPTDAHLKKGSSSAPAEQTLHHFELVGFDETGKKFWKLTGDRATIKEEGEEILVNKNVLLSIQSTTQIRTDRIYWNKNSTSFWTDAPVKVLREDLTMEGVGAFGKPTEYFVQLHRHIKMAIDAKTTVICEGPLKIFYREHIASFYRHVRIRDPQGTVLAQRMDVFFDADTKKVTHIDMVGQVEIFRGNDHSRSNRAIYTVATGAIRLEKPQITIREKKGWTQDGSSGNSTDQKDL